MPYNMFFFCKPRRKCIVGAYFITLYSGYFFWRHLACVLPLFCLYITCSICQGWAIGIVDIHTKQFFHESVKWKSTIFLSFCNWKSNKYFKKCHSSWLIWGFEMCLKLECWLLPVSILLQASAKSFLFWGQ